MQEPQGLATAAARCTSEQYQIWTTRGIGGVRIFAPPRSQQETFTWILEPSDGCPPQDAAWYTDASLLDADSPGLERYGVAAVAINPENGHLVAAAHGVPPASVSCISEAEIWAIAMITSRVPAWRQITTDCQVAQRLATQGPGSCRSAETRAARAWAAIMRNIDADSSYNCDWLTWMPAHTSRSAVGVKRKSDGTCITVVDWMGNAAADALAKAAADTVRTAQKARDSAKMHSAAALHWRATLGARTWTSQNYVRSSIKTARSRRSRSVVQMENPLCKAA